MKWLTLFTSLLLAVCAAYFSIAGLMVLFSGAALSVMVMAIILEMGKLVSTAWLHYEWDRIKNILIKIYFIFAILILMFITSMGIFGYLSKAHIETSISVGGNTSLQIQTLERRIDNEEKAINDAELVLSQLDETVQTLIKYERIRGDSGAIATREAQREERDTLNETIKSSLDNIEVIQTELLPLKQKQLELEVEVGPLKYITELIYGEEKASENLDSAMRAVIILLIIVFDPLAVMLLIVSTAAFKEDKLKLKPLVDETQIMRMDMVDEQQTSSNVENKNIEERDIYVENDSIAESSEKTQTNIQNEGNLKTALSRRPI